MLAHRHVVLLVSATIVGSAVTAEAATSFKHACRAKTVTKEDAAVMIVNAMADRESANSVNRSALQSCKLKLYRGNFLREFTLLTKKSLHRLRSLRALGGCDWALEVRPRCARKATGKWKRRRKMIIIQGGSECLREELPVTPRCLGRIWRAK